MRVAVLPEVTSGWHGIDVTKAEAFLWPEEFRTCPVCGEVFDGIARKVYCSKNCRMLAALARKEGA